MATAQLTRVVGFDAAHRYFKPAWSAAQNAAAFGACANEHRHEYRCFVTVSGPVSPETQMVIDLGAFDRILQDEIVARFDRRHINLDVPEFAYGKAVPTGEALAMYIWERVAGRLPRGVSLTRVRVQEDPDLYADYAGHA